MRIIAGLVLLSSFLLAGKASGQCTNICGAGFITDGGFENPTSTCNVSDIQLYSNQSPVQGWYGTEAFVSGTAAGSTPDYFSACAGSTNSANNSCITGSARIGLFTKTSFSNGREYVQSQLTGPLQAGHQYCFSMVVKSKVGAAGNVLLSAYLKIDPFKSIVQS